MISLDHTIISDDVITEQFICDLNKCKGACCIEGDSGAPLEEEELKIIDEVFEKIKPYLNEKGLQAIDIYGKYVKDSDGDMTTTCVDGHKECAYVVFENGITKCAFEKAYNDGVIDFKKPISCHLYPIRITKYPEFEAVNYHHWHICNPGCALGKEHKTPVFKFLKEPLIRKYGEEWYKGLEALASYKNNQLTSGSD